MKHCLKFIVFINLFIYFLYLASPNIYAETIQVFSSENNGTKKITTPQKIVLIKITPKVLEPIKFLSSLDMLFVEQLKMPQNIFSFVSIDNDIYKLRDLDINFSNNTNDEKIVYIAYTSQIPLQLISDLKNIYNIKNISFAKIVFSKNIFNINEKNDVLPTLPPSDIKISVDLVETFYNNKPAPGELNKVTVKFKNTGIYPILKSDLSKIIVVTGGEKEHSSSMFVNEKWYSKSRAGAIAEDRIGSGEFGTVVFDTLTNVESVEQSEKFFLATPDGTKITNTDFEIKWNVADTKQKLVEIKETGYGFVSLRETPKSSGRALGFVNTGTKQLVLEESSGWIKIKYEGSKQGWIPGSSVKKLY